MGGFNKCCLSTVEAEACSTATGTPIQGVCTTPEQLLVHTAMLALPALGQVQITPRQHAWSAVVHLTPIHRLDSGGGAWNVVSPSRRYMSWLSVFIAPIS